MRSVIARKQAINMTALEALNALNHLIQNVPLDENNLAELRQKANGYFESIRKALTPPSADEVCEAINGHDEIDVKHERGENFDVFYYGKVRYDMNGKEYIQKRIICIGDNREISFNASLPPHLVTLIGRFYEAHGHADPNSEDRR